MEQFGFQTAYFRNRLGARLSAYVYVKAMSTGQGPINGGPAKWRVGPIGTR
jgi:hypothetical protein